MMSKRQRQARASAVEPLVCDDDDTQQARRNYYSTANNVLSSLTTRVVSIALLLLFATDGASSFVVVQPRLPVAAPSSSCSTTSSSNCRILLRLPLSAEATDNEANASHDAMEDINKRVERARELLEKTKAKLAANKQEQQQQQERAPDTTEDAASPPLPFFASSSGTKQQATSTTEEISRDSIVKSKDEKTGLITADGEKMAAISEQEDWEMRSLYEVFENEMDENEDVYSLASQQLANRDVAASIWNLRQKLQTDDYKKIFDKRNHFIGEDT